MNQLKCQTGRMVSKDIAGNAQRAFTRVSPIVGMEVKEYLKLLHYFGIESKEQTFCNVLMSLRNSQTHIP